MKAPTVTAAHDGLHSQARAEELVAITTLEALFAAKHGAGDPYSGRLAAGSQPLSTFQLDYPEGSLYLGFEAADLARYSEVLRRCLLLLGVERGDTVGLFDFGTSPIVYLASACYTPYLAQGAADALGCTVVCNDGVANVSQRGVEILKYTRPRCVIVRADCMQPLLAAFASASVDPASCTQAFVVTYNEGSLNQGWRAAWKQELGLPVYELPRSDLALFMALECPNCHLLHTWSDLYETEVVDPGSWQPVSAGESGRLVVSSRFMSCCPANRILTQFQGRLVDGHCPKGPMDARLCLL